MVRVQVDGGVQADTTKHRCVRSCRLLGRSERDFLRMRCHLRLGCHVVRRSRWRGIPQPLAGKNDIEYGPRCKHPPRQLSLAWRSVDTAMGFDGCCCSFFVLLVEHMRTPAKALAGSASSHLSEGAAFPSLGGAAFCLLLLCFLSILNWLYACIYKNINIYIYIMEGCTTNSEGEGERESTTTQEVKEGKAAPPTRGGALVCLPLSPSPSAVRPWFFHYFFQRFLLHVFGRTISRCTGRLFGQHFLCFSSLDLLLLCKSFCPIRRCCSRCVPSNPSVVMTPHLFPSRVHRHFLCASVPPPRSNCPGKHGL